MDQNLLYRAFRELHQSIKKSRDGAALLGAIARAEKEDKIVAKRSVCVIEEDWIEAIEKGLGFIGKAIKEERQFIRSNGEVLQISKVKRVSRQSVEHLARHSDFISRENEGEVEPERLYVEERVNDYTVYENRFLYMLLDFVKDFVDVRYHQIVKAAGRYEGEIVASKQVTIDKQRLEYELRLSDVREDDPYIKARNKATDILDRLERILRTVYYYLQTPLMLEVAKVDKIKPPITKTNVLRMDKNFKETVDLYEFLMAYDKDGFTITKQENALDPVPYGIAEELAVLTTLAAFLSYEHGLNLEDELLKQYKKEEARRKEKERRALAEKLEKLKSKNENGDQKQYIALLETLCVNLESDVSQLAKANEEIEKLGDKIQSLENEIVTQRERTEELKAAHAKELNVYFDKIASLNNELAEQAVKLNKERLDEIALVSGRYERQIKEYNERLSEKSAECEAGKKELSAVKEAKTLSDARLTALRKEHGLLTPSDDFTSEEAFDELEREFEVLGQLLRDEWKGVKQMLKKEHMGKVKSIFAKQKKQSSERRDDNDD